MVQTHHRDSGKSLTLNNAADEDGYLKIFGKNADALILGDATHEGGNISIYRDTSGNKQLFVNADAASSGIAMSVYGGVVAQNHLTVGQSAINITVTAYIAGNVRATSDIHTDADFILRDPARSIRGLENASALRLNIDTVTPNATDHAIKLQIDANDLIVAQATGDGGGGITNPAIGLYPGTTPATQHAAIANATDAATAITQLNLLLAANRAIGVIAT